MRNDTEHMCRRNHISVACMTSDKESCMRHTHTHTHTYMYARVRARRALLNCTSTDDAVSVLPGWAAAKEAGLLL